MSFCDPIADLLARVRNAYGRSHKQVEVRYSELAKRVLDVLKEGGYIEDFYKKDLRPGISSLIVDLSYHNQKPSLQMARRISKPGRRIYSGIDKLKKVRSGLGVSVLSTSKGVLSDSQARRLNVGGEVLFEVY